jgi:hypothetical protein
MPSIPSTPVSVSEDPLTPRNYIRSRSPSPTRSVDEANPFSPPASVRSLTRISLHVPTPLSHLQLHSSIFDDFGTQITSSRSTIDFSNPHSVSSTPPNAGTSQTHRPATLRNAFAAPSIRSYSPASPSVAKFKRDRPKTTMLPIGTSLSKPWFDSKVRDPYTRISYYITYCVAFLGIIGSGLRCYFGYKDVPMIKGNLCLLLDENFDNTDIFGNGGNWFQEVDLSGYG